MEVVGESPALRRRLEVVSASHRYESLVRCAFGVFMS